MDTGPSTGLAVGSETWSWHSQPHPVHGSPLQAHFCLGGGPVRCLVRGCLQGFLPAAVKHVPAVFLQWWGCQKTERRGGAAQVLKGAVIAISWRDSVLPFSSTLSPLPEIWLVIDQYGLKKWCQPELWIDLLLSVCHSFIAVLSQCVRAKAQHFCHLEKSLAGWCPQEQFPSAEGPRVPFLFTS